MFSLPNLEHQLNVYILGEVDPTFSKPFDISTVPVVTREQALAEDRTRKLTSATPTMQTPAASAAPAAATAATCLALTDLAYLIAPCSILSFANGVRGMVHCLALWPGLLQL